MASGTLVRLKPPLGEPPLGEAVKEVVALEREDTHVASFELSRNTEPMINMNSEVGDII